MKNKFLKKIIVFILVIFLVTVFNINVDAKVNVKDIDNFDLKINMLMYYANIPSISACIIKNDTVVWYKGYGFYNRCVLVPSSRWLTPTNTTQYLIGSISKTITATAMMQIIDNKSYSVDLNDDVNDYLDFSLRNPNFPTIPITFKMLLSHHSSLISDEFALFGDSPIETIKLIKAIFKAIPVINSKGEVLKIVLDKNSSLFEPKLWNNYPPGEYGNYSNLGYVILGYLIEIITGQTYEKFVQNNIFNRLGMNNTSLHPDKNNKMAVPTLKIAGFFIPLPHYDFYFATPAGNIRSSTDDLSKFFIMHINNGTYEGVKILDNKTVELMHKPLGEVNGLQYGLGWFLINNSKLGMVQGHTGGTPGGQAIMYYREFDETGIIIFFNQARMLDKSKFRAKIRLEIINLFFEKAKEFKI